MSDFVVEIYVLLIFVEGFVEGDYFFFWIEIIEEGFFF